MASSDHSQLNKLPMKNMSAELLCSLIAFLLLFTLCSARSFPEASIDDSQALLKAWKDACSSTSGGPPVVSVPKGKTMKLRPLTLSGPCKSAPIRFNVMGTIEGHDDITTWGDNPSALITIKGVHGITIDGSGTIDGRGSFWWDCEKAGKGGCKGVPNSMRINHCSKVTMTGIKFVNPPNVHLGISDTQDIHISHVSINAPEESPNTDGIHIQRSQGVRITDCSIATGDDCVSIGTGTSNVTVNQIKCGPGHGISIGSLGENNSKATVSDVTVSNSLFYKTQTGARIKTWQGGSGYVKNIVFQHLTVDAVDRPIVIDQYYCNGKHDCGNKTSAVEISGIKFIDIHGSSTRTTPIKLACSKTIPCTDITIDDVLITSATNEKRPTSYCLNALGTARNVSPSVSCLE